MLKYCLDRSNIHKMCDKAIDSFLPALKFVPDWFATSQTNKKFIMYYLQLMIYSFFYEDSGNVIFSSGAMGILSRDQNNLFSNARQNVGYYQISTGHFKNPSDIMPGRDYVKIMCKSKDVATSWTSRSN